MGNGCVAEDLALRQEPVVSEVEFHAWRENILHGSLTDEQCRRSAKGSRFWSTVILTVGPAGILSGRRGDTDSLRRACRITARRRDAREPHRLEACAPPHVKLPIPFLYRGGSPNRTVASLEQLEVPA